MIFPIASEDREKYESIKTCGKVLLVGLTGGIASGKSTVAGFMKDLGGEVIDFDILARQVVSPGENAWIRIVQYFGEEILLDNREINRKKLSAIVFNDSEKRKALEGFTHPAIGEAFVQEVEKASQKKEVAIIGVVPLLIECTMQELFHSITLVYIPRDKQIDRLVERDGITRDRAIDIINAQMPIDSKIDHANFVINNSGSIEETNIQVKGVWKKLIESRNQLICQGC
jgi:dephospho-CoA kinase